MSLPPVDNQPPEMPHGYTTTAISNNQRQQTLHIPHAAPSNTTTPNLGGSSGPASTKSASTISEYSSRMAESNPT